MLKELFLDHFILAEHVHLTFSKGLNVISGETGSGKTMITQALLLVLGEKADISSIQQGARLSTIRAVFELKKDSVIYNILEECGIHADKDEDLLITRELSAQGKNRVLIQSEPCSLALLKKIAPYLMETISQHSSFFLKDEEIQRDFLDRYSDSIALREQYNSCYQKERELAEKIVALRRQEKEAKVLIPVWREHAEDIFNASLKEDEEQLLFEKYKQLHEIQEGKETLQHLLNMISEGEQTLETHILKTQKMLMKAIKTHSELAPFEQSLGACCDTIKELGFQLSLLLSEGEHVDEKLEKIEKRLSLIKQLTKKFGPTLTDVLSYKSHLEEKIDQAEQLSDVIEKAENAYQAAKHQGKCLAKMLSDKRAKGAKELAPYITRVIQKLNMGGAEFLIDMQEQSPTCFGIDKIYFSLATSQGRTASLLKDHASGGELSRIYFALILGVSHKSEEKTLLLDELDANMGGVTASLFGNLLKELGLSRQIICITHFPQVASYADHHLQVEKIHADGQVRAYVKVLDEGEKKTELLRMLGGKEFLKPKKD